MRPHYSIRLIMWSHDPLYDLKGLLYPLPLTLTVCCACVASHYTLLQVNWHAPMHAGYSACVYARHLAHPKVSPVCTLCWQAVTPLWAFGPTYLWLGHTKGTTTLEVIAHATYVPTAQCAPMCTPPPAIFGLTGQLVVWGSRGRGPTGGGRAVAGIRG